MFPAEFQSRVESIHKEGGTAWLLILSEMQKQDPPPAAIAPAPSPSPGTAPLTFVCYVCGRIR